MRQRDSRGSLAPEVRNGDRVDFAADAPPISPRSSLTSRVAVLEARARVHGTVRRGAAIVISLPPDQAAPLVAFAKRSARARFSDPKASMLGLTIG